MELVSGLAGTGLSNYDLMLILLPTLPLFRGLHRGILKIELLRMGSYDALMSPQSFFYPVLPLEQTLSNLKLGIYLERGNSKKSNLPLCSKPGGEK